MTTSTAARARTTRSRRRSSWRPRSRSRKPCSRRSIELQAALAAKADEFWPVVKTGRTHLQDATPIRLGQEFRGYAGQVEESIRRARAARDELLAVPLGGTAVGTGINAHPAFAARACARLTELTGLAVRETPNHFHAQATLDVAIAAHGAIRTDRARACGRSRSDVRLMGMGPRAGLAELALPETQPGSSIMPGKVNPVIVEIADDGRRPGRRQRRDRRVRADRVASSSST